MSIVSTIIFCMFIIGNLQVAAEENEWARTGDLLKQEGNYSEAKTAYNKALQIDPYYVNAWDGIGWPLNRLGDYTQAISYLDKALEIDPKNIDALIFKAQALYNIGNHTGAKYYFGKAFEIDPNNELAKKIFSSIIKK